jgi:glycosyltransferase involved in cell wall biosynthesis
MVGTIEPRKAHAQILSAFDHLWDKDGLDVNLIIVGKEGWKGLPEKDRRYITNLVTRLRAHPKAGKNLYWLEGISDEFLSVLYSKCHALIAASWAEGFGLPLAEASHHNIHVIARDIDIFREIAASNAFYFNANHSEDIAAALQEWIQKYRSCQLPPVGKISCRSWYDCCLDITATMNTIFQHENNQ